MIKIHSQISRTIIQLNDIMSSKSEKEKIYGSFVHLETVEIHAVFSVGLISFAFIWIFQIGLNSNHAMPISLKSQIETQAGVSSTQADVSFKPV